MSARTTVLCYGDSNVRGFIPGFVDPKSGLTARYPEEVRWTGILQRELGSNCHVIAEGLNGRTTAFDEISYYGAEPRKYRNGAAYLPLFLEEHFPMDLVILMAGLNDTKTQYKKSAREIAEGLRGVIRVVRESKYGPGGKAPKVLVIGSPPLKEAALEDREFDRGSIEKSEELPREYKMVAQEEGCGYLEASVQMSERDGVHLDEKAHEMLGKAIAQWVRFTI